eukprot:scaffold11629_cov131-Isochrysis_galbana.AAC.7
MRSRTRRAEPEVEMEKCGYSGMITSRVTFCLVISSTASAANGRQYRIATNSDASIPRSPSVVLSASACFRIVATWGDSPPASSIAARACGRDGVRVGPKAQLGTVKICKTTRCG